jgi:hypothetical protein
MRAPHLCICAGLLQLPGEGGLLLLIRLQPLLRLRLSGGLGCWGPLGRPLLLIHCYDAKELCAQA